MNAIRFMLREDHHFKSTVFMKVFSQKQQKRLISGSNILKHQILNKDSGSLWLINTLASIG